MLRIDEGERMATSRTDEVTSLVDCKGYHGLSS